MWYWLGVAVVAALLLYEHLIVRPDDLRRLSELAEQGVVNVHVSETFPLDRTADAHRLNQEGRTRGKIVVTVDWDTEEAATPEGLWQGAE